MKEREMLNEPVTSQSQVKSDTHLAHVKSRNVPTPSQVLKSKSDTHLAQLKSRNIQVRVQVESIFSVEYWIYFHIFFHFQCW